MFLNRTYEGKKDETCLIAGPMSEHFSTHENREEQLPQTYQDAITSMQSTHWMEAMKEEYESLMENQTWTLETLPKDKKAVKSKWVFTTKENAEGEIIRFKARLVAKGYSQIEGIDFQETFAPVVRYQSIRILLSYAAHHELKISQLDAVTAFLNGRLDEEIFIEQPEGFNDETGRHCKLIKALYGLKQSPRVWNQTINKTFIEMGLSRSKLDQCIYYRITGNEILIVAIYVDDILIFSNNEKADQQVKDKLKSNYKMKDLGEASSILGIRIRRNKDLHQITIDQASYTRRILQRFGMEDSNPVSTPIELGQKYSKDMCPQNEDEREQMKKIPYRQAIGSLLFLTMITRPDISFAVNVLSRFCEEPGPTHWNGIKRILRILKERPN